MQKGNNWPLLGALTKNTLQIWYAGCFLLEFCTQKGLPKRGHNATISLPVNL